MQTANPAASLSPDPSGEELPIATVERIGRYSRADLDAMHGKRGRKPPEYFTLFPERIRPAAPAKVRLSRAVESAPSVFSDNDPLIAQLRAASPAVRRLVADLLAVVAAEAPAVLAAEPAVTYDASAVAQDEADTPEMHRPEPVYADPEADEQHLAG